MPVLIKSWKLSGEWFTGCSSDTPHKERLHEIGSAVPKTEIIDRRFWSFCVGAMYLTSFKRILQTQNCSSNISHRSCHLWVEQKGLTERNKSLSSWNVNEEEAKRGSLRLGEACSQAQARVHVGRLGRTQCDALHRVFCSRSVPAGVLRWKQGDFESGTTHPLLRYSRDSFYLVRVVDIWEATFHRLSTKHFHLYPTPLINSTSGKYSYTT